MALRKSVAILALSFLLAMPAAGQGLPGLSSIGVKGGLSFATLRADNIDFGYKTGFVGGLYGQIGFTPIISPRAELLYVQKGGSPEDVQGIPNADDEVSYNVNYIEIPVLVKVSVPIIRQVFPSLYVGPYLSFAVSQSISVDGEEVGNSSDDPFDSTDYGLVVGTDVDFSFMGYALVLSGRYDWGLANIASDDLANDSNGEPDISTGTFMLTLGFGL